jgi:protein-S-isoprenylcysteine O-methyltransferase Ste14
MLPADPGLRRLIRRRFVQVGVSILVQAVILFIAAGTVRWLMAWVFIGASVSFLLVNALVLLRWNPEVVAERAQMKKGAKNWDKVLAPLMAALGPLLLLSVAGLDVRFGWTGQLAVGIHAVGLALLLFGYAVIGWAMVSNRFFSGLVRIQKERGHTVVTAGPYSFVRHPGYLGMATSTVATPLLLGTLWALIPAGMTLGVTIVRTALEDRTLRGELDGYEAYAAHVCFRLLPGIW